MYIFAIWKCFNTGGEYGLEIPANFHFYGPEKAIKLAETGNNTHPRAKLSNNV